MIIMIITTVGKVIEKNKNNNVFCEWEKWGNYDRPHDDGECDDVFYRRR